MDAKEIKTCLKAARESIRIKDFKEALKQCKAILAKDKSHYNALVFVGVSAEGLEQPDQALKAYTKATEVAPEQLLAWQGLSGMIDRNEDILKPEEAVPVYMKLLELNSSDSSKQLPHMGRLADLYLKMKEKDKLVEMAEQLVKIETDAINKRKWNKIILEELSLDVPSLAEEKVMLYKSSLESVLDGSALLNQAETEKYTQSLLTLKLKENPKALGKQCEELRLKFPDASPPLEMLLQWHLDRNIGSNLPVDVDEIKSLTSELEIIKASSNILKVGKAFLAVQEKNDVSARDLLQGTDDPGVCGLYLLSQTHLTLHGSECCINVCEKGLAKVTASKFACSVDSCYVKSAFQLCQAMAFRDVATPDGLEKALELLTKVEDAFPVESCLNKAYVLLGQHNLEEAEICFGKLSEDSRSTRILQAMILVEKENHSKAIEILQTEVGTDASDAVAYLQLGKLMWTCRDAKNVGVNIQECFTTLLKAAKLDPHNYESFLYIGYFYREIQKDTAKARRCFQKAFDLSGGRDEPGAALVDCLVEQGEQSLSLKILKEATAKAAAGCGKWAWLRLGLHQTHKEEPTTAIASLQAALRADPLDNHVWECLADAYFQRGSLTAALKAFMKASELDPESIYCKYQIASIKQILGSLSEAVQEYKDVLVKSPDYVPVLKGLAESLIQLARYNVHRCLDGLAQDSVEEALVYLARAAANRPDLSCLWKLMGDACTLTNSLASQQFRIPRKLVGKSSSESGLETVSKQQLMEVGSRCYSQAVKILPDQGCLWHDLAVCLYHQARVIVDAGEAESGIAVLQRARQAAKRSISLEPGDWTHWNLMGVTVCCGVDENLAQAQHCFIKSIECETSNVVAWSNLGALYLRQSEIQLAHDAFKCAQSVDPTYMACWVGQALIAEVVGHEEAMDLFRHTTELGVHLESTVGYGQWVLGTLGDAEKRETELYQYCIQQMAAVPAALDALDRYTRRVKSDGPAYNMLGLLSEHQKLFTSAVKAYQRAVELFEKSGDNAKLNDVRLNLARTLCSSGQYQASIGQYSQCDIGVSTELMCQYGLALYKAGKMTEAFKVLESALECSSTDKDQSQVHTALGMVAYGMGDLEGAKARLFSSFQTSSPCMEGLLGLCALGLLTRDDTLAHAVLQELGTREGRVEDVVRLHLYKYLVESDPAGGEAYLRSLLEPKPTEPETAKSDAAQHDGAEPKPQEPKPKKKNKKAAKTDSTESEPTQPKQAALWVLLARFLLQATQGSRESRGSQGQAAADCCVKAAAVRDHPATCLDWTTLCRAQLQAGHHSRTDETGDALKSAQRALHANPGSSQAWFTLTVAVHAEAVVRQGLQGEEGMLNVAKGMLEGTDRKDVSEKLRVWGQQLSVINRIISGDTDAANNLYTSLTKMNGSQEVIEVIKTAIDSSEPRIDVSAEYGLHFTVGLSVLTKLGKFAEAVSLITKYLEDKEADMSNEVYQSLLERSAYISYIGMQETDSDVHKMNLDSIVQIGKDKKITSAVINALQAISSGDNPRLSKHHFATALDAASGSTALGYTSSLARQGLVSLLWSSLKESDQKLVQALLGDGKACGDVNLARLVETLKLKAKK